MASPRGPGGYKGEDYKYKPPADKSNLIAGRFKTLGEYRAWQRAQVRNRRSPTTENARGRRVGVAELGEGFSDLANRFDVDVQDLVNANPDISNVSAGAAYNIPPPPPRGGKRASPAWQEDNETWWEGLTPWDERQGETFYEWAEPRPGGPGTPEWFVEQVAPIGQWIKNTVTGAMEWIESKEPQSSRGGGKMASPVAPPTFTSFGTGWDNTYSPGVTPEEMVAGARSERWGQPSLTMRDLVEAEGKMEGRPTSYEPIPAPAKMGNFGFSGGATLQEGFSEQLKNIYNVEPTLRWEKWKSDILGIEAFDREGIDERVANIGYDEWTHQFTENWLYQYASGGEIDWEAVMAADPNAENLLEALGYISTPEAEGGVGGYKTSGGGRGRRRQPVGYGVGQKPYAQPRNAYLSLTSWSI